MHTQHRPPSSGGWQNRSGLHDQVARAEATHPVGLQAMLVHPLQRRRRARPESGDRRSRIPGRRHGLHHQHPAPSPQAGRLPRSCFTR